MEEPRKKRAYKPKKLKPIIYTHVDKIFEEYDLDRMRGQGRIVLDILDKRPGIWNSRELAEKLATIPEILEDKRTPVIISSWWICYFRNLGLIKNAL